MPSSASARTPSGSPIAPIAVVNSPGMTFACTPTVSSRRTTASISACVAWGVITTITADELCGRAAGHRLRVGARAGMQDRVVRELDAVRDSHGIEHEHVAVALAAVVESYDLEP